MKMQLIILFSLILSSNLYTAAAADAESEARARLIRAQAEGQELQNEAAKKGLAATASAQNCEAYKTQKRNEVKNLYNNTGTNENLDGDTGTGAMRKCVQMTFGGMRYLYGKNKRSDIAWDKIIEANDEVLSASKECTGVENYNLAKENEAKANIRKALLKCDAAAYVIATYERDWENSDHVVQKEVKGGNPPISCTGKGVATLDYDGCVKFVQNGDLMEAAQQAIQSGQQLYYADKTMNAQAEAAKSDNSATAALEALKSSVKSQKEIMEQRAALDTGKLAVLANYYMDMPTSEEVLGKCGSYTPHSDLTKEVQVDVKAICSMNISKNEFGFLMNQMAKEKMKAKLVKVGIDVGSDAVMASLMAKREGDLNNAIAKVEEFKPIDPVAPQADNMQTTYCQTNPGDPKCLTGGLDRTFDAMNDNVITFGEGGTGATFGSSNPFTDTANTNTNAVSPTSRNSITGVGGTISAAQQSGGLANPIAAGSITKGSGPAAGGGGGGGVGGGGGGGGGGGAPAGQGQGGGVTAAIQGKTPAYNGGSGFSILGGGYGLKGKKSATGKEENPFGKLFGKNGNANGALNFRDIASQKVGTKGDNLFDMISKRYSTVNSDKRLIEYEVAK